MKKIVLIISVLTVLGLFAFASNKMVGNTDSTPLTGAVVSQGQAQDVKLSFINYNYVLEPSTLKAGVPVRMEVDMSTVYGCMRDVRIPAFGVSKYVKEGDNVIEFTPNKAGTFNIACSMNMGRGTFTVKEQDGSVSSYIEAAPAAAPSCGEGGCGCGGA